MLSAAQHARMIRSEEYAEELQDRVAELEDQREALLDAVRALLDLYQEGDPIDAWLRRRARGALAAAGEKE